MQEYLYNLATDRIKGFIPGIIKALLFLFALLYGFAVRTLIFFYRIKPRSLSCKAISVGNITLGGTGKTALVEYLARYLKQQGRKVAIITRGYKRKITSYELRVTSYENMGDEPFMLAKNLGDVPVVVNSDRVKAVGVAVRDYSADTVILDDAFQQWRIKKDLEIVTIDAVNPFGNRHMIPRGILREPLSSLKRADIFVLTKADSSLSLEALLTYLKNINPSADIFESRHKPVGFYELGAGQDLLPVSALKNRRAALFSGIGDPDSFSALVGQLGIKAELVFKFPDHHSYTQQDLDRIYADSKEKGIDTIITTEKDAVRLAGSQFTVHSLQLLVMRIRIEIKDEQKLSDRLLRLYSL